MDEYVVVVTIDGEPVAYGPFGAEEAEGFLTVANEHDLVVESGTARMIPLGDIQTFMLSHTARTPDA